MARIVCTAFGCVALFCATQRAVAQGGKPPADSARTDSTRAAPVVRDSLKSPFGVSEAPGAPVQGRVMRWNRDELFQGGATNIAELIEHVPGARVLRTGLMLSPQVVLWNGEPARVRLFLDGVELDAMDTRAGRAQDLSRVPIWTLEEVTAEPTPGELRVHMRSWRVARTAPETRVDVLTGDNETNLYRGFYGRRFQSGAGLQAGFEQLNTASPTSGGDGDGLALFARLGWTRNALSIDAMAQRVTENRNATLRLDQPGSVPAFKGGTGLSYVRVAVGSPGVTARWAQLVLARTSLSEQSPHSAPGGAFGEVPADTVDSSAARTQIVLAGGTTIWGIRGSATARYRSVGGKSFLTPSVRGDWASRRLGAQAFVERDPLDSLLRADVVLRLSITSRLSAAASASKRDPISGSKVPSSEHAALDLTATLGRWTFVVGAASRGRDTLVAPTVFQRDITDTVMGSAIGKTFALTGPVYRELIFDLRGAFYDQAGPYRPQNEIHAKLGIDTEWRSRFPHGDLTIRASVAYDHIGGVLIPFADGSTALIAASPISTILEVRIKSATLNWQFRNLLGTVYETVPGYPMPTRVNLYGIRWNFLN